MSYVQAQRENEVVWETRGTRQISAIVKVLTVPAGGIGTNTIRGLNIRNPSARLSGIVEVFYEVTAATFSEAQIVAYNSNWKIGNQAIGVETGNVALKGFYPDNTGITTISLPDSYEWNSSTSIIQVILNLDDPDDGAAGIIPGNWYVRVRWEPNTDISDEELTILFNKAGIDPLDVNL